MVDSLLLQAGKAVTSAPVLIDGQVYNLTLDTGGRLRVAPPTPVAPSAFSLLGAASINATIVKASAGLLYELSVHNPSGVTIFLKLYDKATAPAPATDSALLRASFAIATLASVNLQFGALGKPFANGISFALTTGAAPTDVAAVAANVIVGGSYS